MKKQRKVNEEKPVVSIKGQSLVIVCPQNDYIERLMNPDYPRYHKNSKALAHMITEYVERECAKYDEILIIMDTHVDRKKFRAKDQKHLDKFGYHCTSGTDGWKIYNPLDSALSKIQHSKISRVRYIQKDTFGKKLRFLPDTQSVDVMGYYLDQDVLAMIVHLLDDNPDIEVVLKRYLCMPSDEDCRDQTINLLRNFGVTLDSQIQR